VEVEIVNALRADAAKVLTEGRAKVVIGYQAREYIAGPADPHTVGLNQAFAWNPSITGTKSEDTIMVTEYGPEVLTISPDWPLEEIVVGGRAVMRPRILTR
jgi:hypothetical protein